MKNKKKTVPAKRNPYVLAMTLSRKAGVIPDRRLKRQNNPKRKDCDDN